MCDLQNSENLKRLVHVYRGNSALSTCFVCQIFCFDKCRRNCLNTVTFLVNINDTPDPYLKIEKLNVGTAKIPLVDGLNYLNWCTRTSECLRIYKVKQAILSKLTQIVEEILVLTLTQGNKLVQCIDSRLELPAVIQTDI